MLSLTVGVSSLPWRCSGVHGRMAVASVVAGMAALPPSLAASSLLVLSERRAREPPWPAPWGVTAVMTRSDGSTELADVLGLCGSRDAHGQVRLAQIVST